MLYAANKCRRLRTEQFLFVPRDQPKASVNNCNLESSTFVLQGLRVHPVQSGVSHQSSRPWKTPKSLFHLGEVRHGALNSCHRRASSPTAGPSRSSKNGPRTLPRREGARTSFWCFVLCFCNVGLSFSGTLANTSAALWRRSSPVENCQRIVILNLRVKLRHLSAWPPTSICTIFLEYLRVPPPSDSTRAS